MEIIFTIVLLLFYGATVAYLMWKLFYMQPIYLTDSDYKALPNVSTKYFYQVSLKICFNYPIFRVIAEMVKTNFERKHTFLSYILTKYHGNFQNKGTKK